MFSKEQLIRFVRRREASVYDSNWQVMTDFLAEGIDPDDLGTPDKYEMEMPVFVWALQAGWLIEDQRRAYGQHRWRFVERPEGMSDMRELHQKLIHGLTEDVLAGRMSKTQAEEHIRSVMFAHPEGSDGQAGAILWQIRKDAGIDASTGS